MKRPRSFGHSARARCNMPSQNSVAAAGLLLALMTSGGLTSCLESSDHSISPQHNVRLDVSEKLPTVTTSDGYNKKRKSLSGASTLKQKNKHHVDPKLKGGRGDRSTTTDSEHEDGNEHIFEHDRDLKRALHTQFDQGRRRDRIQSRFNNKSIRSKTADESSAMSSRSLEDEISDSSDGISNLNSTNNTGAPDITKNALIRGINLEDNRYDSSGKSGKGSKAHSGYDYDYDYEYEYEYEYEDDTFNWEDNEESNDESNNGDDDAYPWYPDGHDDSGGKSSKSDKSGKSSKSSKSEKSLKGGIPIWPYPPDKTKGPMQRPSPRPVGTSLPTTSSPSNSLATPSPLPPPVSQPTKSPTSQPTQKPITTPLPTVKITPMPPESYPPTQTELPPLVWKGIDGCNPDSPCDKCEGDCDADEDCLPEFTCFKRNDGSNAQVPGCAVGGPGDIAGADYCHKPEFIPAEPTASPGQNPTSSPESAPTSSPERSPSFSPMEILPPTSSPIVVTNAPTPKVSLPSLEFKGANGCTPTIPCDVCQGDCDRDSDCLSNQCFRRGEGETTQVPGCAVGGEGDVPGADYCSDSIETPAPSSSPEGMPSNSPSVAAALPTRFTEDPTPSPTPMPNNSTLPPLVWKGINGCSETSPCDACEGDCDTNSDCLENFECFKRTDGDTTQVPGCASGGVGDIPGADYCYDPTAGRPTSSPIFVGDTQPPITSTNTPTVAPARLPTNSPEIMQAPTKPPQTEAPTAPKSLAPTSGREAFFLRSQARTEVVDITRHRSLQGLGDNSVLAVTDWCASGALSPDFYQLLLKECTPDIDVNGIPIERIHQLDQLWSMDDQGLIHSIFDYDRCMLVQSGEDVFEGSAVEIGSCDPDNPLHKFYYDLESMPSTLKLQGEEFDSLCVTFLGDTASNGAPLIMATCQPTNKFGWDFISEDIYGQPTFSPTEPLPSLNYEGRDACTESTPCGVCTADCDDASGCEPGLSCFQRGRDETSQVPGCASGGPGDIPGADYCFDPDSPLPQLIWLGEDGCTSANPCDSCTGNCAGDDSCKGSLQCWTREEGDSGSIPGCRSGGSGDVDGGDYCYNPNNVQQPTQSPIVPLPSLVWLGSNGCTEDDPCPPCTGDCDTNDDCEASLACFNRLPGETTRIPGCAVGGLGDMPGGDYCYDPGDTIKPTPSPISTSSSPISASYSPISTSSSPTENPTQTDDIFFPIEDPPGALSRWNPNFEDSRSDPSDRHPTTRDDRKPPEPEDKQDHFSPHKHTRPHDVHKLTYRRDFKKEEKTPDS